MIPQQPPPPRPGRAPVFALVAVAVLLAGASVWMFVAAGSAARDADRVTDQVRRTERAAEQAAQAPNRALVDTAATAEVTDWLRTAIEAAFSYDHTDLDAAQRAADRYLTGDARCQYDQLFAQVREQAVTQRIVLRTTVREVALVELTGERAEAVVFIDQTSTRGDGPATTGASQFAARAERDGADSWLLTSLDFFGQSPSGGVGEPKC